VTTAPRANRAPAQVAIEGPLELGHRGQRVDLGEAGLHLDEDPQRLAALDGGAHGRPGHGGELAGLEPALGAEAEHAGGCVVEEGEHHRIMPRARPGS